MTLQQTHFEVKEGPSYSKSCIFYERTYLLSAHVILQGQNLPDIITIASFKRTHIFEWAMRDQTPFLKNGLVTHFMIKRISPKKEPFFFPDLFLLFFKPTLGNYGSFSRAMKRV